jgi:hypothetical protein
MLKQLKTKKLFYGKWAYKVATVCPGGSYVKIYGVDKCSLLAEVNHFKSTSSSYRQIDNKKLANFCSLYKTFVNEDHQVRTEGSHVNFFVNDKTLYDKIVKTMNTFVVLTSEPDNLDVLATLQDSKKNVVVNELPFGKYKNKVIFKTMPANQREHLVSLLKKYGDDKIRMSKTTERYLTGNRHYMNDPFIYIEDEKMLTMLALAANGYIKRTEKFVLKSSINTSLDQEQTCQPLVKA